MSFSKVGQLWPAGTVSLQLDPWEVASELKLGTAAVGSWTKCLPSSKSSGIEGRLCGCPTHSVHVSKHSWEKKKEGLRESGFPVFKRFLRILAERKVRYQGWGFASSPGLNEGYTHTSSCKMLDRA